jgi:sugar diacid utilization regulator
MTLEYGVTVLALELARQNSLAEVELRLRRDLVEELPGSDDESALARARALGYDLERPHRVVAVDCRRVRPGDETLLHAVRCSARANGVAPLLVARGAEVVVLADSEDGLATWPTTTASAARPSSTPSDLHLEHGRSYDATAAALNVHRSTLKYRLKRIAEVSGHDLANPETVINLQLATRARRIMSALREKS